VTREILSRPPDHAPMPPETKGREDLWLPPHMVEYGYLPPVCIRHGLRAVRMQRAPAYSRTPGWVIPLMFVMLLVAALIAAAVRVTVWGAWPVCEACLTRRRQYRNAMFACLAASALSIVAAIGLNQPGWVLLVVLLIPAAMVLWSLSGWNNVTSSVVDRHRGVVRVKNASPAFVAALNQAAAPRARPIRPPAGSRSRWQPISRRFCVRPEPCRGW
jgi:hypothetical protein